ncbi:MAG: XdhC family protein [Synergistaceae bacterium]|jgi:xanthine dehydrogenase accessory factor|nr:XdhC family protein [Synergistaceae bacterium]
MRNTYAIYAELFEKLKGGEEAFLMTECGPAGVTKELRPVSSAGARIDTESDGDSLWIQKNGETTIIEELFLPRPRMIIFGGGHISLSLSRIASMLDFDVTVFDDRPSFANAERFPWAREVICDNFDTVAERVGFRGGDYAVILTRGHKHDQDCLRAVLSGTIPRYMGMIGSRRRVAIVRNEMAAEGHAPELIARLHSPIGLSIGAVTPEEISIAILAEVIQEKRLSSEHDRIGESYADMELIEWLARQADDSRAEPAAVVTVISARGSTPRESGAKMAVLPDGRLVGTIGGGCAEADVIRDAIDIARKGGYLFKTVDMTDSAEEDGMVCGGSMEVLIESIGV